MTDQPIHSPARQPDDPDAALRPKSLTEFIGQEAARDNLQVFIDAAKSRGEAKDHTLFSARPAPAKRRSRRSSPRNSAQGVERDELIAGVEMALSAMTAHALLQQQGYTINPF